MDLTIYENWVFCTGGGPGGDKLKGSIKYLEPWYNLFSLPILYTSPLKFYCTHNTYINWLVMVMKMKVQNLQNICMKKVGNKIVN